MTHMELYIAARDTVAELSGKIPTAKSAKAVIAKLDASDARKAVAAFLWFELPADDMKNAIRRLEGSISAI